MAPLIAQPVFVIVPGLARPTFPLTVDVVQVTAAPARTANSSGAASADVEETNAQANESARAAGIRKCLMDSPQFGFAERTREKTNPRPCDFLYGNAHNSVVQ